jgi:hypothetical protein
MNNLEPRAKIGDVVITVGNREARIMDSGTLKIRGVDTGVPMYHSDPCGLLFNEDILKNLTTGKKYGNE